MTKVLQEQREESDVRKGLIIAQTQMDAELSCSRVTRTTVLHHHHHHHQSFAVQSAFDCGHG
jgi:hypothetical protein